MSDTKLRPTSTTKSKDKSGKQRFGHVNATKPNSYLNIIFIELVTEYMKKKTSKNPKFRLLRFYFIKKT